MIVTQAQLEDYIMGALTERPVTAGTVTDILNMSNIDVKRSGVVRALERLLAKSRVGYVEAPCIRNGRWVQGRHWYDADEYRAKAQDDDGDPFDGIA